MKKGILSITMLIASSTCFAAGEVGVSSVKLDAAGENLIVDVFHGGGCKKHIYELQVGACRETFPVSCDVKIMDKGEPDPCEAMIYATAVFPLAKNGLNKGYYSRAALSFSGYDRNGKPQTISVTLPEVTDSGNGGTSGGPIVSCVTHTGSDLKIDAAAKLVTLRTTSGQSQQIQITKVDSMSLESNPPIEATTYSLSDKRKIETSFRGDDKTGKGNFVREDGSRSPSFTCTVK